MGMQMRGIISVDTSQAMAVINKVKGQMSLQMFNEVVEQTVRDTGKRAVRKIVKQEVKKTYEVKDHWVGQKILNPRMSGHGAAISCVVPIKGERGTIGGIFPASGGGLASGRANGTAAKKRLKRGGAKIKAKIVKGKTTVLPDSLPNQGGNPPFRLPNGAVVTRRTKQSRPLVRVVGRAVPQMVDKQFEARIRDPINEYMLKRVNQVITWKMKI